MVEKIKPWTYIYNLVDFQILKAATIEILTKNKNSKTIYFAMDIYVGHKLICTKTSCVCHVILEEIRKKLDL